MKFKTFALGSSAFAVVWLVCVAVGQAQSAGTAAGRAVVQHKTLWVRTNEAHSFCKHGGYLNKITRAML